MVKVLVVDDSAFARSSISRVLNRAPGMEIVGQAANGQEAIDKTRELKPDVVTLDVEMPVMDGLTALRRIMHMNPLPVVMVSSLTGPQADATITALELGAVECFLKPSIALPAGRHGDEHDLVTTIRNAAAAKVRPNGNATEAAIERPARTITKTLGREFSKVMIIGSSTGGPKALAKVVPELPNDLPVAFLIVQHMPEGFTKSLAERLDKISNLTVTEATTGAKVSAGQAILARGGKHMLIDDRGVISLDDGPPVKGVKPAIDVTMESAVEAYGGKVDGVILTGMGSDGTHGSGLIKRAGGSVAAEHESTCVVYGMPKAVTDAGHVDAVAPLGRMSKRIIEMYRS